ncbi:MULTISPECIES: hypothetical protein [unclassified Rathayibacter]|uniref:hypothetical protein n=1 Tax=unclassified Rathayibacter TaxID=2609250 RepID=UPI00188A5F79|nr:MULTISPECIES: hypothetical protein [unclassified Rathayibacter]MBF4463341.1 hypothetical protein [Rathayibacter sp. VKM Ac-2879]MBF4504936.1 hypothetical protein [Rathayibacter sp. VKM Ac-2878]
MTGRPPALVRLRPLLLDLLAGLLVASAAFAVIGTLLGTGWQPYFLRDGDSLALPLIVQSLLSGEPLQWVMTSQLFFFPELPLYAISSVAGSPSASLLLNGVLNVVVLFALVRWVSALVLVDRAVWLRRAAATATILLFLLLCLSETRALNNVGALATTFLLTTYYHGSVLVAVGGLALILRLLDPAARGRAFGGVLLVVLVAATSLSNPLLLVHFTAPGLLGLASLWLTAQLPGRRAVALAGLLLGGSILGSLARLPLASFVAADASTYIRTPLAGPALTSLLEQIADVKSTPKGLVELITIGFLLLAALALVLVRVRGLTRRGQGGEAAGASPASRVVSHRSWFLCVFVLSEAGVLLAVQVASGSSVSRYLMPIAVFSCLVLLPLLGLVRVRARRRLRLAAAGSAVVVASSVLLTTVGASGAERALADGPLGADAACVKDWIGGRDIEGVGSFWIVRPLALYDSLPVQQVNPDFSVQVWMSNLASYDEDFSFVLVDPASPWPGATEDAFGPPARTIDCGAIQIYDYAGTAGQQRLDEVIASSLEKARRTYGY